MCTGLSTLRPSDPCRSMFPIIQRCRTSISLTSPRPCLAAPGLCDVATNTPPLPFFCSLWFLATEEDESEREGIEKTTKAADLKHFQLLQDEIFLQGVIAGQDDHLLYCTFVWKQNADVPLDVTQTHRNERKENCRADCCWKMNPRVCFPFASVCFWISPDSRDQFP